MSDRNKKFRNHCLIETNIDQGENAIFVSVQYKPHMLTPPLCFERHAYFCRDVVEELTRQGIAVHESGAHSKSRIDNNSVTFRRGQSIEMSLRFDLATAPAAAPPAPKKALKVSSVPKKIAKRSKTKTAKTTSLK